MKHPGTFLDPCTLERHKSARFQKSSSEGHVRIQKAPRAATPEVRATPEGSPRCGLCVAACALLIASLGLGMFGYVSLEHLTMVDAFLNAAMLLGGMGPVDPPKTNGGKLFAGTYALYAGLVFLIGVGIVLAPIAHRLMHRLHIDEDGAEGADH